MAGLQLLGGGSTKAVEDQVKIVNLGTDWSVGDLVCAHFAHNVAGVKADIRHGSASDPVTIAQPSLKVSRVEKTLKATVTTATGSALADGSAGLSAGHFSAKGLPGSEVQTVGLFASAQNASDYEATDGPDAAALYGFGRITGGASTKASCYGVVAYGRKDVPNAVANGAEMGPQNYSSADDAYEVAGATPGGKSRGIWLPPIGEKDSAVGIIMDNVFGRQYDVGLAFGGSTAGGGKVGAIKSAAIRDDSTGKTSILIKGSHETAAIAVAKGANGVVIGAESSGNFVASGTLLDVVTENAEKSTAAIVRHIGASHVACQVSNSKGDVRLAAVGTAGGFWTDSAEGDVGLLFNNAKKLHIGRSGGVRASLRVSNNVGIGNGAADSFGEGVGVIFIANRTTAPTANPIAGGILYTEGGKLMYRGSSGTVKELASA